MTHDRREASFAVAKNKAGKGDRLLSAVVVVLLAASLPAVALAVPADATVGSDPFRICADPSNLPFSSQSNDPPGLYIELGQDMASALGRPVSAVWYQSYFGKRTIRETLLAGKCDAYIGLPDSKDFMGPKLIFSKPFLNIGYALVSAKARPAASLADLKGKRVAVQLGTSPQLLLADHNEVRAVTLLDPEAAMKALAAGEADAAIVWGPSAGYLNKTLYQDAYIVQPVSGKGMQWPVSVGFARSNGDLRDKIDHVIDASAEKIGELVAKYGFPQAAPVSLTDAPAASHSAAEPKVILAASEQPASDAQKPASGEGAPAPAAAAPAAADPATIAAGREIFDGTCSHCHGPDAVVGQRKIDLRLLKERYGDKMDEVFHYTVTHGRPDKGMPNWTGVFSEEDFSKILAFLHSVQTN